MLASSPRWPWTPSWRAIWWCSTASELFEASITKIGFRRGTFLRGFMCDFIEKFAPHLTRDVMAKAIQCHNKQELEELFEGVVLPEH